MEFVASEFVFDFKLERPNPVKSLEMKYILLMAVNLFADLSMVTTKKHICGVILDKISVIWFKSNEKYSLYFYYHNSFFIYIF